MLVLCQRPGQDKMRPDFKSIYIPAIPPNKKIFFASDFHLNTSNYTATKDREKKILDWLDTIQPEAHALFLLGDIFDFWFEYKHLIPKGLVRLQSKLASFSDANIPVYLTVGNHDYWVKDYFLKELKLRVFHDNVKLYVHNKKLLVGHGDELGGSRSYHVVKKYIYKSSIFNWMFRNLPPSVGFALGVYISKMNQKRHNPHTCLSEHDAIFKYCKDSIEPAEHHDYYIFGHLHFPYSKLVSDTSVYFNIGDWITYFSYGVFDGVKFQLEKVE